MAAAASSASVPESAISGLTRSYHIVSLGRTQFCVDTRYTNLRPVGESSEARLWDRRMAGRAWNHLDVLRRAWRVRARGGCGRPGENN
jgi:hypothetical protein